MVTLDSIFDVWYGVNMEVVNSEVVTSGGIPFVSRQSTNNGVTCYVKPVDGISPNPGHTLSIAVSGTVLSTYYHDYEYYSGRDIYVAKPKIPLTKEEMLYYAFVIEANKYKYNYGRGANKTFRKIMIPAYEELPAYIHQYSAEYQFEESPIQPKSISLHVNDWHEFKLKDLFSIFRGHTLTSDQKDNRGQIPCVNGSLENNGILCYLDESLQNMGFALQPVPSLSLCRVGSSGATFVQENPYYIADNAFCLLLKEQQSKYVYLFLSTILDKECYRYSYGRTISSVKYMQTKIMLPAVLQSNGTYTPDWQFMEDYIKSLPYSKNI